MLKFIIGPICMSNLVLIWIVKNGGRTYILNFLKSMHFFPSFCLFFFLFFLVKFSYKEIASNYISFTILFIFFSNFLYCMSF